MKFSVIVPFYNAAKWIERCMDSLERQQGDFEFILVDDHSTDIGKTLASCYTDERFVILINEHGKGVSGARNTGLDHATGDWVTFLDADDEMLPGAYETFRRMARHDTNIVQAEHLRHYVFGNTIENKYPVDAGFYNLESLPTHWCMVWNKIYKADFLKDIRFVEGIQYGEDEVFNLECFAKDDEIVCVKELMTLRHFDNRDSLSHIKGKEGLIKQARALEDFIMKCDNPRARLAACRTLSDHWNSETYRKAFG